MLTENMTTAEQAERQEIDRAFRTVFTTAEGKRVLFWMLEQCAIYQDAFTGENNVTNYTLGLQAGGRKLIAKLDELDPRNYPTLLLDVADQKATTRAAIEQAAKTKDDDDVA